MSRFMVIMVNIMYRYSTNDNVKDKTETKPPDCSDDKESQILVHSLATGSLKSVFLHRFPFNIDLSVVLN